MLALELLRPMHHADVETRAAQPEEGDAGLEVGDQRLLVHR